jgi:SAM-dependent methyltransferase
MTNEKPLAQNAYDDLAESYADKIDENAINADYDRPATLSLIPDVSGRVVLDAGCGAGTYTEWLIDNGAEVIALDANRKMAQQTKRRVGTQAEIIQGDLGGSLSLIEDSTVDFVVSSLALHYIQDWNQLFSAFSRILRQHGQLICSVHHPFSDFHEYDEAENYFETEVVSQMWSDFGDPVRVPHYRRPLSEMIGPLLNAGFNLDRLLEPTPTEQFEERSPELYDELSTRPMFLCLRARKRG